ncbi:hypothetical protein J3F84DRAFT_349289 [Trichoderma pleuroticola]|uniref:Apple domain-containing protein n=1 Tax=Trichoderma harzianum TaxID=5544 RepID=A0A2K0TX91_TRIHA|nr:hypothetical protein THARTR1_09144 [Trichoderma harzianum]
MAPTYDDSPELAEGHDLPEAYVSQPPPEQVWSPQPSIAPTYVSQPPGTYGNNEGYVNNGAYSTTGTYSDAGKGVAAGAVGGVVGAAATDAGVEAAYSTSPDSIDPEKKAATTVGGLSLVLVLYIIIGVLAAAVIGLAAGTGVATKNSNDANAQVTLLKSALASALNNPPSDPACATGTGTGSAPVPSSTATNYNSLTNGCSNDPNGVTGTVYTPAFFNKPHFTMYCNQDTNNPAIFSVFSKDFNGCMDACAAWNSYNTTTKGTCVAVSFIPSWTIAKNAQSGGAPGDCYLKSGTLSKALLKGANIGTECHAALLLKS